MHDPPLAVLGFGLVETRKRARLGHGGIGEAPSESGRAEIGGNGDGAVGESRNDHGLPRVDFREAAEEVGVWPHQPERERGESANEETGDRGGGGAEPSPPGIACIAGEEPLGQLPERFAERGIAGLHDDGVERPETLLDEAEEVAPSEPGERDEAGKGEDRPDAEDERGQLVGDDLEPFGENDRNKAEQQAGKQEQNYPGEDQLGQADFDQQAAGERQHRAGLGARGVVFDVALPWVDDGCGIAGFGLRLFRAAGARHRAGLTLGSCRRARRRGGSQPNGSKGIRPSRQ